MKHNNVFKSRFLQIYGYIDLISILFLPKESFNHDFLVRTLMIFLTLLSLLSLKLNLIGDYEGKVSILSKLPTYAIVRGSLLVLIFLIDFKYTQLGYSLLFFSFL